MARHLIIFVFLAVLVVVCGCNKASTEPVKTPTVEPLFAPEAAKIEPVKTEPNMTVFFCDRCAPILNTFVDDKGMVNYKELKHRRTELKSVLNEFNRLDPNEYSRWPKEDKIAFWLNAYNLQLLRIVIDNYPIQSTRILRVLWPPTSIRHIKGIWTDYKFIVMDEEFTLEQVDQRFFRNEFADPRVFFGVWQASLSGPPLRNEPYCGYKLYKQLDDQAKKFLSNPLAFNIDREKKVVNLSAIFHSNWYGNYFLAKYDTDKKFKDQKAEVRAALNFIINYISSRDVSFLEVENYSVDYINHDWRLNDPSGGNY